jgi:hypothetical protein
MLKSGVFFCVGRVLGLYGAVSHSKLCWVLEDCLRVFRCCFHVRVYVWFRLLIRPCRGHLLIYVIS